MNKLLKLFAAFIAVTGITFADTALTESLSVSGFFDMSYLDSDNGKESTSGIDQVEFNFTLDNGGPIAAQLDIEYTDEGDKDSSTVEVEEAYITYDLNNGGTVTLGRFETMLLQDDSEPTGVYQFTNAYDFFGGNLNQALYDSGDQGIKYSNGGWEVSLVDNGDSKIGDGNKDFDSTTDGSGDYSIEVGYSGQLSENVTGFIGGRFYEDDANNSDGDILNLHLTYEEGPWIIGGEYVTGDISNLIKSEFLDSDLIQKISKISKTSEISDASNSTQSLEADVDLFSLFANYSYSEKNSVTVRYSDMDGDAKDNIQNYDFDADKITLAHNSALSDDLILVLEYSMQDSKHTEDEDLFGVELLYTF